MDICPTPYDHMWCLKYKSIDLFYTLIDPYEFLMTQQQFINLLHLQSSIMLHQNNKEITINAPIAFEIFTLLN